jgi:hypothetical protein
MTAKTIALVLVLVGVLAVACSAPAPAPAPTPAATPTAQSRPSTPVPDPDTVDWSNYSDARQARVDKLGRRGDCAKLQREFDREDAAPDLIMYVDAWMDHAMCFEQGY